MASIDAVAIQVQLLSGLAALIKKSNAKHPYALGHIGDRVFGRVPIDGDTVDLSKQSVPWKLELQYVLTLGLTIEVYDDQADKGSVKLGSVSRSFGEADVNRTFHLEGDFKVSGELAGHRLPRNAASAFVPRTAVGTSTRATLAAPSAAIVTLTDVRGLYAPVALGKPGLVRAEARPGYLSENNVGRVYLNTDLTSKWKKNVQLIELSAKVSVTSGILPKDAKLRWSLIDIDDPSNDAPIVHSQWGRYIDGNDYDAKGKHHGARAGDNEGKPSKNPPWEAVSGYALSSPSATACLTQIAGGTSKVTFHCPGTAGDNFAIEVGIETSEQLDRLGHRTGVITMWHRIQVEYMRMSSALPLPMAEVAMYLEPMCVQFDTSPERVIPDKQFVAPNSATLESESAKFVNGAFVNKPGWFCAIGALEPHPLPANKAAVLYKGRIKLGVAGKGANGLEYLDVPGAIVGPDYAIITHNKASVGFMVFSPQALTVGGNPFTRLWLMPHDLQPEFVANDGSIDASYAISYKYSPRFTKHNASFVRGGYGMPDTVDVEIKSAGSSYVAGVSPSVVVGIKEYFAGRTVLFTHHGRFFDAATKKVAPDANDVMAKVLVHEFIHAFGMPHKCGYFDFTAPRDKTCCMNYPDNWMIDDKKALISNTNRKLGPWVCGRHLKEVRRVHLEDNKGLNW